MPTVLETHTSLVKAQFGKAKQRMTPQKAAIAGLTVEVLSGTHAGSSGTTGPSFSIGPDASNDVMLLDDEALGGEARFATLGSVFGPLLTVTTDRNDLRISGAKVRPGITSGPEKLPCEVDFNGIRMRLSAIAGTGPSLKHRAGQAVLPILMTITLVAFGTQAYLASQPQPRLVLQTTQAPDPAAKKVKAESAEGVIRTMITEAGLTDRLKVEKLATGTLSIEGTLPPDMMSDWHQVRSEIDKVAGSAIVISDVSETHVLTDMPPISAVRLGADPIVILANGEEFGRGEKISGDWVIRSITEEALELERNGDSVVLTF